MKITEERIRKIVRKILQEQKIDAKSTKFIMQFKGKKIDTVWIEVRGRAYDKDLDSPVEADQLLAKFIKEGATKIEFNDIRNRVFVYGTKGIDKLSFSFFGNIRNKKWISDDYLPMIGEEPEELRISKYFK